MHRLEPTIQATPWRGWGTLSQVAWRAVRREGLAFLLVVAPLLVVVRSVEDARWVDAPLLMLTATVAVLVGAILSRARISRVAAHGGAVALGLLVAYLQTAGTVSPGGWPAIPELNLRLSRWLRAVVGSDISTDTVPFTLLLTLVTWVVGYLTAWAVFRYRNVWIAVLPSGMGLLTNLSYLPDAFFFYFFLYLLAASALVIHTTTLQQQRSWSRDGVEYRHSKAPLVLGSSLLFVGLLVVVVLSFPVHRASASPVRHVWERVRDPVDRFQEEFIRVFSGLPARKPIVGPEFTSAYTLASSVPLGDTPIFYARGPIPAYWRARSYSEYTSKGWRDARTLSEPFPVDLFLLEEYGAELDEPEQTTLPTYYAIQGALPYRVKMASASSYVFFPGLPLDLDFLAQIDVRKAESFTLRMDDPSDNVGLSQTLQDAAARLDALSSSSDGSPTAGQLLQVLPSDVAVTQVLKAQGKGDRPVSLDVEATSFRYEESLAKALKAPGLLVGLELEYQLPSPADVVSVRPPRRLPPEVQYSPLGALNGASEEQLRSAGTRYPEWVKARYLQVPEDIPQRVQLLVDGITSPAVTSYDSAVSIEDYLRTLEYNPRVGPVPFDADAVDHFLFELKEGHGDHFASAMVMMLRIAGIPARFVSGYGPGEEDPEQPDGGAFIIRQRHRHAWPEAFFPGYGWVQFEPTPIYPKRPRGLTFLTEAFLTAGADIDALEGEPEDDLGAEGDAESLMEDEDGDNGGPGGRQKGIGFPPFPFIFFGAPLGKGGLLLGGLLLLSTLVLWTLWRLAFVVLPRPEAAYFKMRRLASWTGVVLRPSQTPSEFSCALAATIPDREKDIRLIADLFARRQYGRKAVSRDEAFRVARAWMRVRRVLLRRLLQGAGPTEPMTP